MKKALLLVSILFISVISTACINNFAVQELNNKAKESMEHGDYVTAIERLKASIDLDGTLFETHYNLGVAYTKAEDYGKALIAYEEALKLKPDFADAYYSIAVSQENLAKDIMSGIVRIDENKQFVKLDAKELEAKNNDDKKHELTQSDKDTIVELLNNAIQNYNTYLTKNISSEDKTEVENSVAELTNTINTYQNGGDPTKPIEKPSDAPAVEKFVVE